MQAAARGAVHHPRVQWHGPHARIDHTPARIFFLGRSHLDFTPHQGSFSKLPLPSLVTCAQSPPCRPHDAPRSRSHLAATPGALGRQGAHVGQRAALAEAVELGLRVLLDEAEVVQELDLAQLALLQRLEVLGAAERAAPLGWRLGWRGRRLRQAQELGGGP